MRRPRRPAAGLGGRLGVYGQRVPLLVGGSVAAQVISLVAYPVLGRLYEPAEYGALSVLMSLGTILGVLATGRYQMAILLPAEEDDAVRLTSLTLTVAAGASVVLSAPVLAVAAFARPAVLTQLGTWSLILPVVVLLISTFETLSYFSMRRDRYLDVTRSTVTKAATGAGLQVGLGFLGAGLPGLLIGYAASLLASNRRLALQYVRARRGLTRDLHRTRQLARLYSNFPKFDLWATLANVLAYNLTVFGMAGLYSPAAVGQYALAYRIVALPTTIVGTAVGQVYFREAARRNNLGGVTLRSFDKLAVLLALVSLVPFLACYFLAEDGFALTLGETWRGAGEYAAALTPLVWARFIASPLSNIYLVLSQQHRLLGWQVAILSMTAVTFGLAWHFSWSPVRLLTVQSLAVGVVYAMLAVAARAVLRSRRSADGT